MRTLILIALAACGTGGPDPQPEPVVVATTGEDDVAPPAEIFGGDAASWIAEITDAAVRVMRGEEPPASIPVDRMESAVPWVQMRDDDPRPSNVHALFSFFEGEVTMSEGTRAEVVVLFTDAGPRLARVAPRPPREGEPAPIDPYLEPIAQLGRAMLADFRAQRGGQHVMTGDELRQLIDRPDLVAHAERRLPSPEDIALIEQMMQEPGIELAHIAADQIGVLMRDPTSGELYGVDLRFHERDGTYRFDGPPLLRVQRLPVGR